MVETRTGLDILTNATLELCGIAECLSAISKTDDGSSGYGGAIWLLAREVQRVASDVSEAADAWPKQ